MFSIFVRNMKQGCRVRKNCKPFKIGHLQKSQISQRGRINLIFAILAHIRSKHSKSTLRHTKR